MKLNDYQEEAHAFQRHDMPDTTPKDALGLAGETGEVVDYLKKTLFHGHPMDEMKLADELGDVLWYLSALATRYGFSLEFVARRNIAKLAKRYPEGFSTEASIARRDVQPQRTPRGPCVSQDLNDAFKVGGA